MIPVYVVVVVVAVAAVVVVAVVEDHRKINFFYLNHPVAEGGSHPILKSKWEMNHLAFKPTFWVLYCNTLPQVIEQRLFLFLFFQELCSWSPASRATTEPTSSM